jgi:hypothetical protein
MLVFSHLQSFPPLRFLSRSMPPGAKQELSYTQFWTLAGEGRVDKVTFYGPEKRSMLALLSASAPGGARTIKVRSGGIAGCQ